jgi:hypothetical protein
LTVAPLVLAATLVHFFGVNSFIQDELMFAPFVRSLDRHGSGWVHELMGHSVEHRLIPFKLVLIVETLFSRWSAVAEMWISVGALAALLLGAWRIFRDSFADDPIAFVPLAWIICNLAQYGNLLTGISLNHFVVASSTVWALWLLTRPGAWTFIGACALAALASSALMSGLLAWPVGVFVLIMKRARRRALGWSAIGACFLIAELVTYSRASAAPSLWAFAGSPLRTLAFAAANLGSPLACGQLGLAIPLGIGVGFFALHLVRQLRRHTGDGAIVLPAALTLYAALTSALVAMGRSPFGLDWALLSRYVTAATLSWVGLYPLALLWFRKRESAPRWPIAILALFVVATDLYGIAEGRKWRGEMERNHFLLQSIDQQPDSALTAVCERDLITECREDAAYLRRVGRGPFSAPADIVMPVSWQDGAPSIEVLPGHSIEQSLVCTVSLLRDVDVVFQGRPEASSTAEVQVFDGDRPIGARRVRAEERRRDAPIAVAISPPLGACSGRRLRVRIESPDATMGTGPTVWTYPRYLEGSLLESEVRREGRSLGLWLNALHYGLIAP